MSIERFRNWLMHRFGRNKGSVMSWTDPSGRVWIGFMCECGTIHGAHDITNICYPELPHTRRVKK